MAKTSQLITVDIRKGGLGDIWMRLVALYSLSKLVRDTKLKVVVPEKLLSFSQFVLGDRLDLQSTELPNSIQFTSLGIRDLLVPAITGRRFALPYARAVIRDRKSKSLKQFVNTHLLSFFDALNWLQVPPLIATDEYQGYLEIVALKRFRNISPKEFYRQLSDDYGLIASRLQSHSLPRSDSLQIPEDLTGKTIVFPTGTGRQFMPAWWASKHLPDAYFAFFDTDKDRKDFVDIGLRTISFFREPGDILILARHAKYNIATDSFCSHLIQYSGRSNITILMTELAKRRVISPGFKGCVVDSLAPCYPCLHLARGASEHCQAGHIECLNWTNPVYSLNASRTNYVQKL